MTDHDHTPWIIAGVKSRDDKDTGITLKMAGRKVRSVGDGTWEYAECSESEIDAFVKTLRGALSDMTEEEEQTHLADVKSVKKYVKANFREWLSTQNLAKRPYRKGFPKDSTRPTGTSASYNLMVPSDEKAGEEEESSTSGVTHFVMKFTDLAQEPEWRFPVPPVITHSQIAGDDSIMLAMAPNMRHRNSGELVSLVEVLNSDAARIEDTLLFSLNEQGYDFAAKSLVDPYHIYAFEICLSEHITHELNPTGEGGQSRKTKMPANLPGVNLIDLPDVAELKQGTIYHSALTQEDSDLPVYTIQLPGSSEVKETVLEGGSKTKKRKVELSLSLVVTDYRNADAPPILLDSSAFAEPMKDIASTLNGRLASADRIAFDAVRDGENSDLISDWGFDLVQSLLVHLESSHIEKEADGSTVRKNGPKLHLSGAPTLLVSCTFPSEVKASDTVSALESLTLEEE